jgi:hypothetical protein
MENDIFMYTLSYLAVRLALFAGFVYVGYRILRSASIAVDRAPVRIGETHHRAHRVFDDRC